MHPKRILFYLAHPAHFHLFKHTVKNLKEAGHEVLVTIKSKDVLQRLLDESGLPYTNIAVNERKAGRVGVAIAFLQRMLQHWQIARKFRPDIFVSTSAEFAPIGKWMGIKFIAVFEDDLEIFPFYSKTFVRFLDHQLCPVSCSAAQWNGHPKTIKYKGNHELAYLRPEYFQPDYAKVAHLFAEQKMNFFLRFAQLTAWHDDHVSGITDKLAMEIIERLEPFGKVHLSSERPLPPALEKYRVQIKASDILDVLAFADLYIGDSQTMTAEAAVLGTPAIRFNDFVGKLGYLEELEHVYGLTFGISATQPHLLLQKIDELLQMGSLKENWMKKRTHLLENTIDPTKFFTRFIGDYPDSTRHSETH